MIKGRITEALIEELFLLLDYKLFRYGMDNTVPGIMKLLKGIKSQVTDKIRSMPDFIIQHPKTKEVFFIEVKYRKSESFSLKDLKFQENYPYDNAYIVLVSKKHIKCISVKELKKGKEISPSSKNYLGSRKEFELNKEIIIHFCKFAIQFFSGID